MPTQGQNGSAVVDDDGDPAILRSSGGGAVVVHVNDERVAGEILRVEKREQTADVFVDVVDHAEKVGDGFGVGAGAAGAAALAAGADFAYLGTRVIATAEANAKAGYRDIFDPTVPLSRHVFKAPTRFYKTGVVFMAYLNGLQEHFTMVGGQQSTRSLLHLAELFRLADAANLLEQPELAVRRMNTLLALHGIE